MPRGKLVLALMGMALAMPVGAHAQSAGENQYVDPFQTPNQAKPQAQRSQPQPGTQAEGAQSTPSTSPPVAASSAASASPADVPAGRQLPRTGIDLGWLAASGFGLLALGVALRHEVRRRPPAPSRGRSR